MRGRICLATLVAIGWVVAASAGTGPTWVDLGTDVGPARVDAKVVGTTADTLELEIRLPGLEVSEVEWDGSSYTRLELLGGGWWGDIGAPRLPALRRFIEVPDGADVSVEVNPLERISVDLGIRGFVAPVEPMQLPIPKCDCEESRAWTFHRDDKAYATPIASDAFVGPEVGMRDHRLRLLSVHPVGYDPARGVLEVVSSMRVTVRFSGGDARRSADRHARLGSPAFDAFLGRSVVNLPSETRGAEWQFPTAAPVGMLIITPPDLVTALTPFVEWKTSCGYDIEVATTSDTGTTTAAIKAFIQSRYNGADPPVYVLMIGDSPSPMPTFITTNADGGSDLPYVQMDGDLYPDLMIARWPVDNATELAAMRDKILDYEQATADDAAWLNRALFLGGDDYRSPHENDGFPDGMFTHQDIIAELMGALPNAADCTYWEGDTTNYTTSQLIADLNTGRAWAVYSAHSGPDGWSGDPPLSTDDMPNFGNTGMYPIAHGHSCQSNEWAAYDDVFGEAAVIQPNKGFVAYWGGSNSTYWDGDDWLERGFFDALLEADLASNSGSWDGQFSNIAACYAGLTEVTLKGGGGAGETYYWEIYNLNGDPTLDPYTRAPSALIVAAPSDTTPGTTDPFDVTVTDGGGGAVEKALVAVSQGGTLLGAGWTDADGLASFPVEGAAPGDDLLVRVTAHNRLPTDASVIVGAGSDGVVVLDRSVYRCDGVVGISVFDADLDAAASVDVTLGVVGGSSTTVTLTPVPGVSIVQLSGTATLGVDLAASHGDVLQVSYSDDDSGSGSGAVVTDTAALDCAGPVITGLSAIATEGRMTVSFATDEPGTTEIRYGTSKPPATLITEAAMKTSHQMVVDGLTACTTYYVEAASTDALGNRTVDDDGGAFHPTETAGWAVLLDDDFATDPGWTIDNGGNGHGWAFGTPTGGGGQHGEPDPTSGVTGDSVYGVNLAGDYDNNLVNNQLTLTTPAVDCSLATSLKLRYWRWLGVESSSYDHARVQVSTNGGGSWTTVWENTDDIDGGSWVEEVIDLTAVAAGAPDVTIRWTLGSTDTSYQFAGWNLDDVRLEGAVPCSVLETVFMDGFETGGCDHWSAEVPGQ